jgi:hypothetical protein
MVWALALAVALTTGAARADGPTTLGLALLAAYLVVSLVVQRGARSPGRGAHRSVPTAPVAYGEAVAGR